MISLKNPSKEELIPNRGHAKTSPVYYSGSISVVGGDGALTPPPIHSGSLQDCRIQVKREKIHRNSESKVALSITCATSIEGRSYDPKVQATPSVVLRNARSSEIDRNQKLTRESALGDSEIVCQEQFLIIFEPSKVTKFKFWLLLVLFQ